jgi:hypothetical protein
MATLDDHLSKIGLISNSLLDDLDLNEEYQFAPECLRKEIGSPNQNNSLDDDGLQKYSSMNLFKDCTNKSEYHTFGISHQSTKKILEPHDFAYSHFRPVEENLDSQQTIKPVEQTSSPGFFEELKKHNSEYMKAVAQGASTYTALQENLKRFFTDLSSKQSEVESHRSNGTPIKYKEKIEKLKTKLDDVLEENSRLKGLKLLYETKTHELKEACAKADVRHQSDKQAIDNNVCHNCTFYIEENKNLTQEFGRQISDLNIELTLSNNRNNKLEYDIKLMKIEMERLRRKSGKHTSPWSKENRHPDSDLLPFERCQHEFQPYSKTMEFQKKDFGMSHIKSLNIPSNIQTPATDEIKPLKLGMMNLYDYLYRESEDDSISKLAHQDFDELPGSFRATNSEAKTFKFENDDRKQKQGASLFKPAKEFRRKICDSRQIDNLSESESIDGPLCHKNEASHFTVFAEDNEFCDEQEFCSSTNRHLKLTGHNFPRKSDEEFSIAEIQWPVDSMTQPDIIITLSDNQLYENRETDIQDQKSSIIKNGNLVSATNDFNTDFAKLFFKQPKSVGQLLRVNSEQRFSLSDNFASFAKKHQQN